MKIVIFSGTTEGRRLSGKLAEAGAEVTVCVASDYGREEQGELPGVQVRVGPLSPEEKRELLQGAALCVDATHPYARHISESVKAACKAENTPLLRLKRPDSELGDAHAVESAAEAAAYLAQCEGNILLTTGAKELRSFAALPPERLFPRILPSMESIAACEEMGIPHRNIIAMQGPFSREMNAATIRQYEIRILVSKDGGGPGGFAEKAAAARETGAELIVIRRPEENGLSFDEVLKQCITMLSH
jgi:precorrin-6x reductase